MDSPKQKSQTQIRLVRKLTPEHISERERLLMQYAGIFPKQIREFAETVIPRMKKHKNFAR